MNENGISRAEQRVREMNEMAQQYVRQGNNFMNSRNQQPPQRQDMRQIQQPRFENMRMQNTPQSMPQSIPRPPVPEPPKPVIPNRMQGFGMDTEKLMILLIMYLLIKEKADFKLIAALGYLLL